MKKAVLPDKDDIPIPDISYNAGPDLIWLSPNAIAGLKRLMKAGSYILDFTQKKTSDESRLLLNS